ncbi:2-beta-glucuronyltransferase [Rhizobium sp. NFR07]|uniref:GumK N-terminal domain-containing glycosyltransferase n=1 Tax=Rhizobium sp. NFR07 TaxID=1566262 RepID=UPI0008EF0A62|nr:hypothetical protein [Rhizobium sp. NFR07]SFB51067.1 2-beta-glucuronyltransferase [Rhizobium sp. NFR07]
MRKVVFISAFHDFRTMKRASIHHVAAGLAQQGYDVSFLSTRYSYLSKIKGDSRLFLWNRSNVVESERGVNCYLQRTLLHPFSTNGQFLDRLMPAAFAIYAKTPDKTFDTIVSKADFVIVESSVAVIYLPRIKRLNSHAKIIYYATDLLETVGAHHSLAAKLEHEWSDLFDHVSVRSEKMAPFLKWARGKMFKAEFGVNSDDYHSVSPSPFTNKLNAVSVGSMLFDADFFTRAAPLFPEVDFHIIGSGTEFDAPRNVIFHSEMPFRATLPFITHTSIGIAPYRCGPGVEYLGDSSLKLAQFEHVAKPTVCPNFAMGSSRGRYGYQPGDTESIRSAMSLALENVGKISARAFPSWGEVGERILYPQRHPHLQIS